VAGAAEGDALRFARRQVVRDVDDVVREIRRQTGWRLRRTPWVTLIAAVAAGAYWGSRLGRWGLIGLRPPRLRLNRRREDA
jgi:hypothetical protein